MRFLTITCNAAVDITYRLDRLALGEINRVVQVLPVPGGKGNNVARVLAALGQPVFATGFAGGHQGRFIEEGLRAAGVEPFFVDIAGESRVCLTIVEQNGRTTEIREPGATLQPSDGERLLSRVATLATFLRVASISGSLPPGVDDQLYARLIKRLRNARKYVALDSSGAALRSGLAAGPNLIKPNAEELADLLDGDPGDALIPRVRAEVIERFMPDDGAVLLSRGSAGATLIKRDGAWSATPPPIDVVNTVGSGDALLAGFLAAHVAGGSPQEALAAAVATGTAAALQAAVGTIDPRDVERLRPRVLVAAIEQRERSLAG